VNALPLLRNPPELLDADALVSIPVETCGDPQELIAFDLEGARSRTMFCTVTKVTVPLVCKWRVI
jgi:hypothetical protein